MSYVNQPAIAMIVVSQAYIIHIQHYATILHIDWSSHVGHVRVTVLHLDHATIGLLHNAFVVNVFTCHARHVE